MKKTKERITDAEANALVRAKLNKQSARLGYDAHSLMLKGDILLCLDDAEILIPDGSGVFSDVYKMDEETAALARRAYDIAKEKYEKRKKRRDNINRVVNSNTFFTLLALSVIAGLMSPFVFAVKKENKRQCQAKAKEKVIQDEIDAYVATLPNWDDSVRMAKSDEDLQRALNRREQAQLKIAYYADSLRAICR